MAGRAPETGDLSETRSEVFGSQSGLVRSFLADIFRFKFSTSTESAPVPSFSSTWSPRSKDRIQSSRTARDSPLSLHTPQALGESPRTTPSLSVPSRRSLGLAERHRHKSIFTAVSLSSLFSERPVLLDPRPDFRLHSLRPFSNLSVSLSTRMGCLDG